jgi:hypothetical protein
VNGSGVNGTATNGTSPNDTAPSGMTADGTAPNGIAADGAARNGYGEPVRRGGVDRPARPPRDDSRDLPRRASDADVGALRPDRSASPPSPAVPPAVPPIPDARRHPSPIARGTEREAARAETRVPLAGDRAAAPPEPRRPGPLEPLGPRGPMAALPSPRPDDTIPPITPTCGTSSGPGRGLRRRVPQSHLAPELRHAANGLADTAAPLAANAAASALSRYQASRLAAQSVVDLPDGHRPDDEGERR